MKPSYLVFSIVLVTSASAAAAPPRLEMDLNGTWQYQRVAELATPPKQGEWQSFQVPGTLRGYNYERGWLRRDFTIPGDWRGKRIKIEFDGIKYNSRVFINGRRVGGCFNGYDAFEVDATAAIRFGASNQLAVGFHDWTGVFSPGKFDFSEKPSWQRARRYVTDKVIAPIGGHYDHYGIWGDVRLVAHPSVYVSDLFIKPSVRQGTLSVEYTVTNDSPEPIAVELRGIVEDQGRDKLKLPPTQLEVLAGKSVTTTIRQDWTDARYWSHEDPYLYSLRTELSSGDVQRTRFGFREFWIEGHRYILNGVNVNLLATSWWPPTEPMPRKEVEQRWQALKAAGIVCFRTHTQPWRRVHYDVADELGLLMIIEGAMWHDPYCTAYHDPTYWDNYAKMIQAMIAREKNRPSVIMWSMENEAYSGEEKTRLAVENLARVGTMAKQWDPTRPIYFESDGDPGGVADAIGMHYVHEYPEYTCWPNEAYWLEQPCNPRTWFGIESEPFLWKKQKPLYIGEFLWVPSGTPANHTVFFGDEAYRDLEMYTRRGKAEAWKMQILAFREQEVGGMCPWTVGGDELNDSNPLYRAHQYAYQHLAAYCHDYDRRFFAHEIVERRVSVFNDTLSAAPLTLNWTLSRQGDVIDQGRATLQLDAGDKRSHTLTLHMPGVDRATPLVWQLELTRSEATVFRDTHRYTVYPRLPLPTVAARVALYEQGNNAASRLLDDGKVHYARVDSLERLPADVEILIIGPDALRGEERMATVIGRTDPRRDAIAQFCQRGGRVLVLRQSSYPEGLFELGLTEHKSTMTFPLRHSHPALEGIVADDLKFWRGDNMVAVNEPPRPASGAVTAIVVSGSKTGISHAPLLERSWGQGCIVHSQLMLVEKADTEPVAGLLLGNLLQYLSEYRPTHRRVMLVGGDTPYRQKLTSLGLRFDSCEALEAALDLAPYSLVIVHGEAPPGKAAASKLQTFVAEGGHLLVHRPGTVTMSAICEALAIDLDLQPYSGPVIRADGDEPLLDSVTREDLYWTVKTQGLSWARQPRSRDMTDGMLGRAFDATGLKRLSLSDWEIEGQYVYFSDSSLHFATVGTAVGEIEFPESGSYGVGIRARGTSCQGIYPMARISIDGEPFGLVQLDGNEWTELGTYGYVEKGRRRVSISFVNDGSNPPHEDRNLEVHSLLVGANRRESDASSLTIPAAVVAVRRGSGLVLVDRLRWDTEEYNGQQADRYACSLLSTLDADFTPRPGVTIQCEQMAPQPEMNYFDSRGGVAYMGCNGYIKTTIEVAKTNTYALEVLASGDDCNGICPLVEVHVDGQKRGDVQLTTEGWSTYSLELPLEQGQHEFSLVFVNDESSPTGDRNLRLDKVTFYP
jgi:hypothetical protein